MVVFQNLCLFANVPFADLPFLSNVFLVIFLLNLVVCIRLISILFSCDRTIVQYRIQEVIEWFI